MPDRPFALHPYKPESWEAANVYALHFSDRERCEFERFVTAEPATCSPGQRKTCRDGNRPCRRNACRRRDHLTALLSAFGEAITSTGFRLEFFRPLDSGYKHPVAAMESGPYRLYGMRYDAELFIVGGGAAKFTRGIDKGTLSKAAYDDIEYAAQRLRKKLKGRGLNAPPRDARGLMHLPDDFHHFV